jgi:hypothetical protein
MTARHSTLFTFESSQSDLVVYTLQRDATHTLKTRQSCFVYR